MKTRGLTVAFVLPAVVTAATLAGVRANRSGGRDPIVLTEHELVLSSPGSTDNTATVLRLSWQPPPETAAWITREKLEALGFACDVDPAAPDAERHYRQALAREVYLALEFDGPAWEARQHEQEQREQELRERELRAPDPPEPTPASPPRGRPRRESASRLVVVDAARTPEELEARYPDPRRHLITAGTMRVRIQRSPGGTPALSAVVLEVTPAQIFVPSPLAPALRRGQATFSVRYGRRYEPWLVEVGSARP